MSENPWIPYDVEFFSDIDRPDYAVALWAGHRWFGYDLVRWAQPQRMVELGTHYGCSFFAFCQALQAERSECEIIGIDTWEGDNHTIYGDEPVYETFTTILERRFAAVRARVQRSTFDDALDIVADGSVDIMHIDGLHTYDAVKHDYETWKDKLAPNGIVLFHDVAPSSGLGSARYWQEIRDSAPGFMFMHSLGLGIYLPNGTEGREALLDLGRSAWRPYYEHRAGHDLRSRQVIDLSTMVDTRDEALTATEELVVARDEALTAAQAQVVARDEALVATEQLVMQRDTALTNSIELVGQRDRQLAEARKQTTATERTLTTAKATIERREQELTEITNRRTQLDADLAQAIEALDREVQQTEAARAESEAEIEHLHHHIAAVTTERDSLAAGLDLYRRTLKPVRWAAGPPRRALRKFRGRQIPALESESPALIASSEPSPLFDADWYLARYPDVARADMNPWAHWVDHGWKEGREPCPLFNAGVYLEQNADVAAAGVDPLEHFVKSGAGENRDPSQLFSTEFYRRGGTAGDAGSTTVPSDCNPLDHYLDSGLSEGLFVSPEHEQRVLSARTRPSKADEVLVDVVVHQPDGSKRSIPYSMIVDLDADLFTFDLWDSILTRSRPADASKLATARRIRLALGLSPNEGPTTWELMQQRVKIEAAIAGPDNGEYLLGDVLVRLLTNVTGTNSTGETTSESESASTVPSPSGIEVNIDALADYLRRAELEDEMASTTPIGETTIVMEKLLGRGDNTQVAVVSDFYLGGEDLRELLAFHGIGGDRLPVISSADTGCSKHAGGALLTLTRERFGVASERHVHVGDNFHSDVAMQTETGGIGVYLTHGERRYVGPGQLNEQNVSEVLDELGASLDAASELRCRKAGLSPRPQNRVLQAAWRTALLPVALVAAAIEDAEARGLDRVHYISREGLFLSRVHEEVASILAPQGHPAAVHLAVSRRSTFGPSLGEISPSSLLDLWRMYSRQTPRGLLVSLGANAEDYRDAASRHKLKLDEVIDGVHLDPRIKDFLEDEQVGPRLEALNAERRDALRSYLGRQTDLDLEELIVVDVGWRGTVQDNLARLLPDTKFVGWYLALFPFLNPQLDNCSKFSVGPDGNQGQEFAYMEPPAAIERPWTPAAPSVVDYRAGNGAASVPVLDEETLNAESRAAIELYQDAVIEAAPTVARWIVANGAATDVLRPLIEQQLDGYYKNPEPGIADLWFDSAHDDTFGVLNVTSFGKDRPNRSWFHEGTGPGFLRHLEDAASASLWPSGYRRWRPVEAATAVEQALRTRSFDSGPLK